jgi:hypothetical protein
MRSNEIQKIIHNRKCFHINKLSNLRNTQKREKIVDLFISHIRESINTEFIPYVNPIRSKRHAKPPHGNKKIIVFIAHNMTALNKMFPINFIWTKRGCPQHITYINGSHDTILIREENYYDSGKYFYRNMFHEMAHALMAKPRWNLKISQSAEELVADISALIILWGFGYNAWNCCLGYSHNWSRSSDGKRIIIRDKKTWKLIAKTVKKIIKEFIKNGMVE